MRTGRLSKRRFTQTPTNKAMMGAAIVATTIQSIVIAKNPGGDA